MTPFSSDMKPVVINVPPLDLDKGVRAVWMVVVDDLVEET